MKRLLFFITAFVAALFFLIDQKSNLPAHTSNHEEPLSGEALWQQQIDEKIERRKNGYSKMDRPDLYQEFHAQIRTREGAEGPEYPVNHRMKALRQMHDQRQSLRIAANGILEYTPRGPANVPGRTRGLLVLPGDPNNNTWMAGSAGGGIWKTTNAGESWTLLTPDFPTLAVSSLAMSEANPDIIYAGTGEYIASIGTAIEGQGVFKSTDGGNTWMQLNSTVNTLDFLNITRIIVDPNNPNLVLVSSAPNNWRRGPDAFVSTIMRSEDGGASWTKVFQVTLQDIQERKATGAVEQLLATPGNFNILYASMHAFGPIKSVDGGLTWQPSNSGMAAFGRVELAISPVKPDRLYASVEGSLSGTDSDSDLYISDNAGEFWSFLAAEIDSVPVDFLGGQGWYDNAIQCDPYDADIVYAGGVSLFRFTLDPSVRNSYILEENNLTFLDLVNFGGDYAGVLEANEFASKIDVEVRFGPGVSQMAHRYLVPEDATSGVPPEQYFYQDYVSVPFEVWDVTNNRQLMIGFRDQGRDGEFTLKHLNTDPATPATEQSREYLYIADIAYSTTPDPLMAVTGGHEFRNMYFFWPVLEEDDTWNPANLPSSTLSILYNGTEPTGVSTRTVADVYGEFDGINRFLFIGDVHPDQHNMIMIPVDESQLTYKILLSNDGGVFYSNTDTEPGVEEEDWTFAGNGYVTTQFYGAEKMPGEERFLGGTQDNGTWHSPPAITATESTDYLFAIGGDGFEVIWHALDPDKMIGGSQFNRFRRSLDGGDTWVNAESGITGNSPFISKLANSDDLPEVIYTVSSAGVFRSENFGGTWNLTPINEKWLADVSSTFLDVEVSNANANIIWAGSGMTSTRNLHYSTDGGRTFNIANNYADNLGTITRLGSHPLQENTAYALFSFAQGPKVLRTTDLGQTWEDISGFGANNTSSRGFPDVAVYTIYVRPDNPDIIWVGSEIGIVESLDNGNSWHILDEFPNASVWQISGRDNFLTIATHGRGIWTARVDAEQRRPVERPVIDDVARVPNGDVIVALSYPQDYDSTQILINSQYVGSIGNISSLQDTIIISGLAASSFDLTAVAYVGTAPIANLAEVIIRPDLNPIESFFETFTSVPENISSMDFVRNPVVPESKNISFVTPHDYPVSSELIFDITPPVVVSAENPVISYEDIAIVQPGAGNDFVVVEGTIDGLNWVPLIEPYDAGINPEWQAIFEAGGSPDTDDFMQHQIDLTNTFNVNDTIFIRFRLHSDAAVNGWGWAVDDLFIQTEVVGVDDKINEMTKIFPNPADDQLIINFNNSPPTEKIITVLDITGKKMMQKASANDKEQLDVHKYKNGIYLLLIEENGNKKIYKFIVRH